MFSNKRSTKKNSKTLNFMIHSVELAVSKLLERTKSYCRHLSGRIKDLRIFNKPQHKHNRDSIFSSLMGRESYFS